MSGTWTFYELQNKYEFHPHSLRQKEVSFNRVCLVLFVLFSYLPVHTKGNPFLFILLSFFRDPLHFSQTWTLPVNDFLSLHSVEGLQTLNDKWKVTKAPTCKSVHLKMCSQSQNFVWSLASLARWQCSLTKRVVRVCRSFSETERKTLPYCLFISNSTRFPGFSPQRGTNTVKIARLESSKPKFLPYRHCPLQNQAVGDIKHVVVSSDCKNPWWAGTRAIPGPSKQVI